MEYSELISTSDLSPKIQAALGSTGLGIIGVKNIPGYSNLRRKLLPQSRSLALLSDSDKEPLIVRGVAYPMGWRHGTDTYQDVQDLTKASFFANPEVDFPHQPLERPPNVWPEQSLPGFKADYNALGLELLRVSALLARHLDLFISSLTPRYKKRTLEQIITQEKSQLARLLHYYPQDNVKHDWCGWHNDHAVLTGLTAPMYLDHQTGEILCDGEIDDPNVGLFVKNRDKESIKVVAEADVLYFQTGEATQIFSGGKLQATPHAVLTSGKLGNAARSTFAMFMQPRNYFVMEAPNDKDVFIEHEGVPTLKGRWEQGITHGEFISRTMKIFYPNN